MKIHKLSFKKRLKKKT